MPSKTKVNPKGSAQRKTNKRDSFMAMTRRSSLGSIEAKFSHNCCRSTIMIANFVTLLVGLIFASLGGLVVSNAPLTPPTAAIVLIILGGVVSIVCLVALIAGCRVKSEMKQQKQIEKWTSRLQGATCAQKTLNSYFFLTLLMIPVLVLTGVWLITSIDVALMMLRENCVSFGSGGVAQDVTLAVRDFCSTLDTVQITTALQASASLCFVAALLQIFAALGAIRIVTLFAIMQRLLQMINLFFVILGYAIAFFGAWALQMNGLQGGDGFGNGIYYTIIVAGAGLCVMALIGFMAAHRESRVLLWIYALVCLLTLVASGIMGFFLSGGSPVNEFVQTNCDKLVVTMDETWFKNSLGCNKYVGQAEYVIKGANESEWATRNGPGIVTSCSNVSTTKFAWEYNLGLTAQMIDGKEITSEDLNYDIDGKAIAYHGCINRRCCDLIEGAYELHKTGLGVTMIVVAALVGFALFSSIYMARTKAKLHKEGFKDDSPMLLHTSDSCILLSIVVVFFIGLVYGIWIATGGQVPKTTLQVDQIGKMSNIQSDVQIMEEVPATCNSLFSSSDVGINNETCHSCADGVRNNDETCADGGGSCQKRCDHASGCLKNDDCESSMLCHKNVCQNPDEVSTFLCANTMHDVLPGHVEAGKDCGAICGTEKLCPFGTSCSSSADCAAQGACVKGTCIDCKDKCGGVCPSRCDAGKVCATNSDCKDGVQCYENVCASCNDGMMSGDETCVDGGAKLRDPTTGVLGKLSLGCKGCEDGLACLVDLDCANNHCDQTTKTCSNCYNAVKDGSESDVNCGGGFCKTCALGQTCQVGEDCTTQLCIDGACVKPVSDSCTTDPATWELTCYGPTCQDGLLTPGAGETCTDGGGATCRMLGKRCAAGEKCTVSADCDSGNCYRDSVSCSLFTHCGICVDCKDNAQTPNIETDTDCGGPCTKCADGKKCVGNGDCVSGNCDAASKICVSCQDGLKNQGEVDVDCGSIACKKGCQDSKTCVSDFDCLSGSTCVEGKCHSCHNGIKDGMEADVDCGTECPVPCSVDQTCLKHTDCITSWCSSNQCAPMPASETCTNEQKDGAETCVDGGGPACAEIGLLCEDDATCIENADCMSGQCIQGICVNPCKNKCGGNCAKCDDGASCIIHGDCASGTCDAVSKKCISCSDGVVSPALSESDVDCGGGKCSRCANAKKCSGNSDCFSGNCYISLPAGLSSPSFSAFGFQTLKGKLPPVNVGSRMVEMFSFLSPSLASVVPPKLKVKKEEGICVACNDHIKNGDETDVDCGGSRCSSCANSKHCFSNSDCASMTCNSERVCVAPPTQEAICSDGKKNENSESDLDCGNKCSTYGLRCADEMMCQTDNDCQNQQCSESGRCISCSDGIKNGLESCVDGGGKCAKGCSTGSSCRRNTDCVTGRCELFESATGSNSVKKCASCSDGIRSGLEWPTSDCGGSCGLCATGKKCETSVQCKSNFCADGICRDCFNGVKDFGEDDVDCGEFCATKCGKGSTCTEHHSCTTGYCDSTTSKCANVPPKAHCTDGVQNNDKGESCVDGGGPGCRSLGLLCAAGASCRIDKDCTTRVCEGGTCSDCSDSVRNGNETGLDCGGRSCKPCSDSQSCRVDQDCESGDCDNNGICRSCSDGTKNGLEQDVDCGAVSGCGRCADGKICASNEDCKSALCGSDNKCQSCSNNIKDSDESDVDCGGISCSSCGLNMACVKSSDCVSGYCSDSSNTCKQPTPEIYCANSILDSDKGETSLDCGGLGCRSLQKTCAAGASCGIDDDCTSGICDSNSKKCIDCANKCATLNDRCPHCADGTACDSDSQCGARSICENLFCVSHHDQAINFNETDVDCGGSRKVQAPAPRCGVGGRCKFARDCDHGLACSDNACRIKTEVRMETTSHEEIVISSSNLNAAGCASVPQAFRLVASGTDSAAGGCKFRVQVSSSNRGAVRVNDASWQRSGNVFQGGLNDINEGLASLSLCPLCGHAAHTLKATAIVVGGPCELGMSKRHGASATVEVDVRSDSVQVFHGGIHRHEEEEGNAATLNLLAFGDECSMSATTVGHDGAPHSLPTEFRVTIPHTELGQTCATLEIAGTSTDSVFVHVPRTSGSTNVGTIHVESSSSEQDDHTVTGTVSMHETEMPVLLEVYKSVIHDASCLQGTSVAAPIKTIDIDASTGEYHLEGLKRGQYTLIVRNIEGYHSATHIIHLTGSASTTTSNFHLIPMGEGLHVQAEWSHGEGEGGYGGELINKMHLYIGFKATVKQTESTGESSDIFCRVFGSRASCGGTHFLSSKATQELIHIKKVHESIYTIFARNYDAILPTEASNLRIGVYDKVRQVAEISLPAMSDRTKYLDYTIHGDEKFQNGAVNTNNPQDFQPEARFVRLACIALDGSIHAAPEYSYHQTSLLSDCPPLKVDYCKGGVRKLNVNASSSLSFSDGSDAAHHYLNNMECRFDVTAPSGMSVQVTFPTFDLEVYDEESSKCPDFLEIDGTQYCGGNYPSNLLLEPPFSINFKSDASTTNLGFSGRLELVDVKKNKMEETCTSWSASVDRDNGDNCGGCLSELSADCSWCASTRTCSATSTASDVTCPGDAWATGETTQCHCSQQQGSIQLQGKEGTFYDGSPSIEKYKSNSVCAWEINIPTDQWMKLTFVDFDLEDGVGDSCWGDYLTIGDGATVDTTLCGNKHGEEVCRPAGTTKISLNSDASNEGYGFLAKYEIGTASDLGCSEVQEPIQSQSGCTCKGACNPPNDQYFYHWCDVDKNEEGHCHPEFQEAKFDSEFNIVDYTMVDKCGISVASSEFTVGLPMGFLDNGGYGDFSNDGGYGGYDGGYGGGGGYGDFSMDMEGEDMAFQSFQQGYF